MRLTVRLFGLDLLDVELSSDSSSPEPDEYDPARDLSGGTTTYDRIDPGPTDVFMGFTNGRDEW